MLNRLLTDNELKSSSHESMIHRIYNNLSNRT